ncbi:hypothetical protein DPMN_187221 [Dreissena polymorpha]|uniref:C2H2-type domain-containing protein n=3 Tax=Dreissena polymorpha TaxID=45954 RepID=A0A9D4DQK5_DREPO|nr:hypothetical protein DPMN_187221 [Dreissena polymorpha]
MDSVVRFCYDFCKEAKLGHLIIASPYQESVIHLDRITTTKQKLNKTLANKTAANGPSEKINNHLLEVQKVQVEENSFCEENNTSIKQSVSGTIKSTENNIVASREEFGIAEAASTENPQSQMQEIDWVTNDPSQSNIPIRKRGRNRKHVSGTLIRNTNSFDMADGKLDLAKETCHTGSGNDGNVNVQTPGTVSTGTTNVPASTCSSELLTEALKVVEVLECQNNLENVQHIVGVNKDNLSSKAAVNTDNEHQRKIENEEYTEMVDLPDPLASGILDDNELKKSDYLNEMFNEKKSATTTPAIKALKQTVTRPSTRFRKRLTHLSILEVASQKKAKSNDTSGKYVKVPSLRIKTKGMKVKEHQTVETDTVTSRQDDRLAAVEMATQEEHDIPLGTKDYSRHPNINKQLASPQKCLVVHKDVPVFFNNKKQQDTGNKEEVIRTQSKGNENQPGQMGNNVSSENHMDKQDDELSYASPPKKARLRKLTTEIINISDKVLMRQPPKKRSKEIREMMKIEDDKSSGKTKGGKTEACSKIAINLKTNKHSSTEMWHVANQGRHVDTTANKTSILYNSHAVTEKVAQLELKGSKTTNIKLYRCCFCDREFLIAKRAITHVVNTHEIDLEDSVQYINIEDKNSPTKDSKMCDICGYKTKECGIYYIHYHKYFKHGVPLPKGWEPFRCDLCKKEFYTKFQLREHKLVHFEDNPFVCDTCGTKFKTRTALNSHVFHKHNKEKKFQCQECPKSFKTRTQIKVHMRVHSGEKPFLCPKPECQYRSTTRGNMKLHLSTKHKLQPNSVKQLMDALRPSVPGESNEIDVYIDNPDMYEQSLSTRSKDGATSSHLPSEILVFSDNRDHGMNNVYGGKNSSVMMSREENGDEYRTGFNRKAMGSSLRDYEALNDSLPMTMSQTNDENSSLNIDNSVDVSVPGQVQLFIQEVDKYIAEHSVPVSLTSNANVQKAKALDFYAKYGKSRSDMPKVIDPNSKEARIFLKEAFEHPEQTSLLKPALYQNTNHLANLIHVDHQSEQETRMSTKWNFNESDNLVIDLPDDVQASNSDIQKIHSQLENLRSSYQFRDNVSEVDLLHNINTSSQSQALDTGVLNVYHQRSASPPAYPNSSEMMVSMKAQNNDIVQPSDLTMDNVGQGEGQGHLRSNQQLLSGTLYSSINSRSTSSVQYGADGQLFEGYYQDQYDIENY